MGPTLRLGLNAVGVKAGERDVKAAFDRIKTNATQTAATVDSAATRMGRSFTGMGSAVSRLAGRMNGQTRFIFQNTANQLGDIAVQASMGTNMFRVLGFQLPQIAGGFALMGGAVGLAAGVLGVVAAVGFPLIAMFTSMGDSVETTADKIDNLSDAVDRAQEAHRLAGDSAIDLSADYGILTQSVQDAAAAVSRLEIAEAGRLARQAASEITQGFGGIGDVDAVLEELRNAQTLDFSSAANSFLNLQERLGLGADEAARVARNIVAVNDATTDTQRAEALNQLAQTLSQISPYTESGAAATLELAKNAQTAGEQFARILSLVIDINNQGSAAASSVGAGRGRVLPTAADLMMMRMGGEYIESADERRARLGTGGKSAIEKERDELERFADGIKPVLSLLQEYEQNMQRLNRAREIGAITSEEFAQKEAILTQQFGLASGALIDYTSVANTFANSLERSMMAMVDGTMSVQDAFKSMAVSVIKELYRILVVQQMVNAVMGAFGFVQGTGGGYIPAPPIPTMEGGGYTGAGPRTGGLDGRGGFLAMLHPNETVTDHTMGGGGAGGVVVNQTINVSAGVAQTVRAEMNNMLPAFRQQATQGVLDAKRRGGSYRGALA